MNLKIFKLFSIFECKLRERANLTKSFDDSDDVELEEWSNIGLKTLCVVGDIFFLIKMVFIGDILSIKQR